MKPRAFHPPMIALASLLLAGCWTGQFATTSELQELRRQLDEERTQRTQLDELVGQLSCSDTIRETLNKLIKACQLHAQAGANGAASPICPEDAADQSIGSHAVRNPKSKYFDDMAQLRHLAIYLSEEATGIDPKRRRKLESFLGLRQLSRTKYLLATSDKPSRTEAERRIRVVRDVLKQLGVPDDRMENVDIIYDYFPDGMPKSLKPEDVPIAGGTESKSLRSSVWVYRLDCL